MNLAATSPPKAGGTAVFTDVEALKKLAWLAPKTGAAVVLAEADDMETEDGGPAPNAAAVDVPNAGACAAPKAPKLELPNAATGVGPKAAMC